MNADLHHAPHQLSNDPHDFIFRVDGIDAGRCYLRRRSGNLRKVVVDDLRWAGPVKRKVDGVGLHPLSELQHPARISESSEPLRFGL